MPKTKYEKFDSAVRNISAYAIALNGKPVGRLVVKFGNAATAYIQFWGEDMFTARASGYGYDKRGASVAVALLELCAEWSSRDTATRGFDDVKEALAQLNHDELRNAAHGGGFEIVSREFERVGFSFFNVC